MKEEFKELFDYNHHYNQKLIALISENLHVVSDRTLKLMNHIINAHQIWNARIIKEKELAVWHENEWKMLVDIDQKNHIKTATIIAGSAIADTIEYTTFAGTTFSNKIQDILFHVINHSTYHRAQIATELKHSGVPPLPSDYILYKRQYDK